MFPIASPLRPPPFLPPPNFGGRAGVGDTPDTHFAPVRALAAPGFPFFFFFFLRVRSA